MSSSNRGGISRRVVLGGVASGLAAPAIGQAIPDSTEFEAALEQRAAQHLELPVDGLASLFR